MSDRIEKIRDILSDEYYDRSSILYGLSRELLEEVDSLRRQLEAAMEAIRLMRKLRKAK